MNAWDLITASLRHYRRVNLAVAAGVAVATAVITGALLVGDSVRGSLRGLALDRLGAVDSVLTAARPFREGLPSEVLNRLEGDPSILAEPAVFARGTLTLRRDGLQRRAAGLSVVGVQTTYWGLGRGEGPSLEGNQIALTADVASELNAEPGDTLLLRVPRPGSSPAESVLGEKLDATNARRLKVAAVLPSEGLANFSLTPNQQRARNVFVPLPLLQDLLEADGQVNAVLFGSSAQGAPRPAPAVGDIRSAIKPKLADYGVTVEESNLPGVGRVATIASDRLVLPPHLVEVAERVLSDAGPQPVVTYLANTIRAGDQSIPYSTVTGVASTAQLGPLVDDEGSPVVLADDEVALTDWAADDLGIGVGDRVQITYYEPETTHGELKVAPPLELTVRLVLPLEDGAGEPTALARAKFTPSLPGVTDQDSINDWDLPFELVEPIRQKDEDYWNAYGTTPKAFVSLPLARRLWQTRWGDVSLLRVPLAEGQNAAGLAEQLAAQLSPEEMGLRLLPVKAQALQAASGTTPFEGLFLGFSFFLMASAVMLIALLFRLGIDGRGKEFGLLGAVGLAPRRQLRVEAAEAAVVAVEGAAIGAFAGVAYARLMVYGLSTWWVEATAVPFLRLHVRPQSLALGAAIGLAVALLSSVVSLRGLLSIPTRALLAGVTTDTKPLSTNRRKTQRMPLILFAAAVGLGVAAYRLEGEAQAGAFFGSGALVLTALLLALRASIRRPSLAEPSRFSVASLAAATARRNPGRTLLAVGLTAVACFLIAAISAFRLAPTEAGTGGFAVVATADQPIVYDLATTEGREALGINDELGKALDGSPVCGFRVHDGEDASCLNLYQTSQPTVLGVPDSLAEDDRFGWASRGGARKGSPWLTLNSDLGQDGRGRPVVPVALDKNTAAYSLHLGGVGSRLTIRDAADQPVTLQVAALLAGSVLQGKLMISDEWFVRLFPETSGRRLFLAGDAGGDPAELAALLETELGDFGVDAVSARDQLAAYLAVQNTYLSTFQSLGGLGLLLGTLGLAVAQLRSVVERRGELALLRAVGWTSSRLASLVLGENLVLLALGLAIGSGAALVAVLPHAMVQEASPPWATLGVLLGLVVASGVAASWLAISNTTRAPLLPALRGD